MMGKYMILTLNTLPLTKLLRNDSGLGIIKGSMKGIILKLQTEFKEEKSGVRREKPQCGRKRIICIDRRPSSRDLA